MGIKQLGYYWRYRVDGMNILLYVGFVLVAVAVAIVESLPFVIYRDMRETDRLMAACLLDRPEYECAALLKRSSSRVVPMPIVVR